MSIKRINARCARQGQKHVGSLRFAWYCSLRIFARYAGVIPSYELFEFIGFNSWFKRMLLW